MTSSRIKVQLIDNFSHHVFSVTHHVHALTLHGRNDHAIDDQGTVTLTLEHFLNNNARAKFSRCFEGCYEFLFIFDIERDTNLSILTARFGDCWKTDDPGCLNRLFGCFNNMLRRNIQSQIFQQLHGCNFVGRAFYCCPRCCISDGLPKKTSKTTMT